jgi:protein involved in temperature-dependent protein secretion
MGATEEFAEALDTGDYKKALSVYRTMEHARTPVGKATEAFLHALTGDLMAAIRTLRESGADAPAIEAIVKGERDRTARWTQVEAASSLSASEPLPFVGVYAGIAVALLQGDKALIDGAIAADKAKIPAVAGTLTFRDGRKRAFKSIVDSDDGIGAMLESYGPSGLLYMPFASLRSITFLPPKNFIDRLVPRADVVLADGTSTQALVPMLYAQSSTSSDKTIAAGRMTTWSYVGSARRGLGQRDFVLDGGMMIGMQNVAAIELDSPGASAAVLVSTERTAARAPLPVAQAQVARSNRTLLVLGLVLAAIVVIVFLVVS